MCIKIELCGKTEVDKQAVLVAQIFMVVRPGTKIHSLGRANVIDDNLLWVATFTYILASFNVTRVMYKNHSCFIHCTQATPCCT